MATQVDIDFRLLGPLDARAAAPLGLGGAKRRALLAFLLLHRGEVVSTDAVIDALWGDSPPPAARKAVHVHVSKLRKALGDGVLQTRSGGYLLDVPPERLDAGRFERLVEAGRAALEEGDPESAAARLREALALWRGDVLADLRYELFAQSEIRRLEELRLSALEDRIDADLALGRARQVVPELEALIGEHPLRERLRAQLMLALYRAGRQADALGAYRDARRTLDEQVGLHPGARLRELERSILVQDPSLELPARGAVAAGRRNRRRVVGAAVAVAVAIGVVVAVALARDRDTESAVAVRRNSVAVLDPRTTLVTADVRVGKTPTSVAAGEGAVWVLNGDDRTLSRIDRSTRKVVRTVSVGGTPTDLAVERDAVWVITDENVLVRIDPESSLVERRLTLPTHGERPPPSLSTGAHVAVGAGSVWATKLFRHGFLWRVDPHGGRVLETIRLRPAEGGGELAVGEGAIWINGNGGVTRVDLETRERTRIAVAPGGTGDVAAGGDAIWVAGVSDGVRAASVWRIDPRRRVGTAAASVGTEPTGVAVGAGAVWVADHLDGTVSRIPLPLLRPIRTVRIGGSPYGVAVDPSGIWVAVG